jgi:hypothetical protein
MSLTPSLTGELNVVFNGETYRLRPTFRELTRLEADTQMTLVELADLIGKRKIGMQLTARIIHCGLAGGKAINPSTGVLWTLDEVGNQIADEGLMGVLMPAAQLIIGAVSGGRGAEAQTSGKAEAGTPT